MRSALVRYLSTTRLSPLSVGIKVRRYSFRGREGEIKMRWRRVFSVMPTESRWKRLDWNPRAVAPAQVSWAKRILSHCPVRPWCYHALALQLSPVGRRSLAGQSWMSQTVVRGIGRSTLGTNTLTLLRHKRNSREPLFQWQSFVPLTSSLNYPQEAASDKFHEMGRVTRKLLLCTGCNSESRVVSASKGGTQAVEGSPWQLLAVRGFWQTQCWWCQVSMSWLVKPGQAAVLGSGATGIHRLRQDS